MKMAVAEILKLVPLIWFGGIVGRRIGGRFERGAVLELEREIAPQANGTGDIGPGGEVHCAAARSGGGLDRSVDRAAVGSFSVALCAEALHVEDTRVKVRRQRDRRQAKFNNTHNSSLSEKRNAFKPALSGRAETEKDTRKPMRYVLMLAAFFHVPAEAVDRPGTAYPIFPFPANMIPRIDGNADDWKMVPDSYSIGMDQLVDDTNKDRKPDPQDLDVKVKVGWVKGLNRLYFLYEAYDNYWDFSRPGLHNDIFELVVDGDLSAGPLIESFRV